MVEQNADGAAVLHADHLGLPATDLQNFCAVDDLPVLADNGARALTMAEQWFGAARDVEHAVVALIGRGVGVIEDGAVVRGASNGAGNGNELLARLHLRARVLLVTRHLLGEREVEPPAGRRDPTGGVAGSYGAGLGAHSDGLGYAFKEAVSEDGNVRSQPRQGGWR